MCKLLEPNMSMSVLLCYVIVKDVMQKFLWQKQNIIFIRQQLRAYKDVFQLAVIYLKKKPQVTH